MKTKKGFLRGLGLFSIGFFISACIGIVIVVVKAEKQQKIYSDDPTLLSNHNNVNEPLLDLSVELDFREKKRYAKQEKEIKVHTFKRELPEQEFISLVHGGSNNEINAYLLFLIKKGDDIQISFVLAHPRGFILPVYDALIERGVHREIMAQIQWIDGPYINKYMVKLIEQGDHKKIMDVLRRATSLRNEVAQAIIERGAISEIVYYILCTKYISDGNLGAIQDRNVKRELEALEIYKMRKILDM